MKLLKLFFVAAIYITVINTNLGQNYVILNDYSGQINDNSSSVNDKALELINLLPEELRGGFKVFKYGSYIHTESMYGDLEASINDAINKANESSDYYLLFIQLSSENQLNITTKVILKLPIFSCIDQNYINILESIIEGTSNKAELGSLGIFNGLTKAIDLLDKKIKCCAGQGCASYSAEEISEALAGAGYVLLPTTEIFSTPQAPGGGILGNVKLNLTFEDHSVLMTEELQTFLQYGGSQARMREFNDTNSFNFIVDKLTSDKWQDLVFINLDGQRQIYANYKFSGSSGFRSKDATPGYLIYYSLRFLVNATIGATTDILMQWGLEYSIGDHQDLSSAWNALENGTVAGAIASGAIDGFVGLFNVTKAQRIAFSGTSAAVGYIASCATDPSSFNSTTCMAKFFAGATTGLIMNSVGTKLDKWGNKLATNINSKGKQYIEKLLQDEKGVTIVSTFQQFSPSSRKAIYDICLKVATNNSNSKKVIFGKWIQNSAESYEQRAGTEYTCFYLQQWEAIYNKLFGGNFQNMLELNKKFILEQKNLGKSFFFSHNPEELKNGTYFKEEMKYIGELGCKGFKKLKENLWEAIW